ncbi:MAG: hypothetical protein P4L16_05475 [Chlamydiales bacterium]|nr:hypothetical protein [Chlamydiales bacterium]
MHTIGSYRVNLDRALYLLGPANRDVYALNRHMQHYVFTLTEIAMAVLRFINYFFGDHVWYDYQLVRDVVEAYIKLPEESSERENPELKAKVKALFTAIKLRSNPLTSASYGEGLVWKEASSLDIQLMPPDDAFMFKNKRIVFLNRSAGDSDLKKACGGLNSLEENEYLQLLENERMRLETSHPSATLDEFSALRGAFLPPRTYVPKESDPKDIREDFNPRYKDITDPHKLFALALEDASLGNTEEGYRIAVYNLHKQAQLHGITGDSCHPSVKYSESNNMTATYQEPYFSLDANDPQMGHVFYKRDLFSSEDVGCDPLSVKILIKTFERDEEEIKAQLQKPARNRSVIGEKKILCDLIDVMADQMILRYGNVATKLKELSPEDQLPGNINGDFKEYIKNLRTPQEVIKHSMLYAAMQLGKEGFIVKKEEDDEMCCITHLEDDRVRNLICYRAIFLLMQVLESEDDFSFSYNTHVMTCCGMHRIYVPSADNKNIISSQERRIAHELAGDGSDPDVPAGDPIKAAFLLKRLGKNGSNFVQSYLEIGLKSSIYRLEYGEESSENLAFLGQQKALEREFKKLDPEVKKAITEVITQLRSMGDFVKDKHFNVLRQWMNLTLELPESKRVPVVVEKVMERAPVIEKQFKGAELKYFGDYCHLVTIKKRSEYNALSPKLRVQENEKKPRTSLNLIKNGFGERIFNRQYKQINSGVGNGNCMYASLALEIFDNLPKAEINSYILILRKAIADYIRDHKKDYREAMIQHRDWDKSISYGDLSRGKKESEESHNKRVDEALETRCKHIEATYEDHWLYGSDLELSVLADMLGVEIEVYRKSTEMSFGTEGANEGRIDPCGRYGKAPYKGAAILLHLEGVHYTQLVLKT